MSSAVRASSSMYTGRWISPRQSTYTDPAAMDRRLFFASLCVTTQQSARMTVCICWLAALFLLICLHQGGAIPNYSGSPNTIDEAMRSSPGTVTRRIGISSRIMGEEMVDDGSDLVLTQKQYNRLYKGIRGRSEGRILAVPWKDGVIPYEIKPNNFNDDQVDWIQRAMRHWEQVSCIRFRPAAPQDENRVVIQTGQGCWANLGMVGGSQIVNLDPYCFWIGMIEHELGHTIGLIHEHQRPQRDAYIRVNYYAVESNFVSALEKYARGSDDKYGLPYDYTSVMHYGKTAFSANVYTQTLFTRDPTQEDVIGMILGPSFLDAKLVNLMYKCHDYCDERNRPRCRDDCFVNAQCQCVCKEDMPQEQCRDRNETCAQWKADGECHGNMFFTHTFCRKSCGICTMNGETPHLPCLDGHEKCQEWAARGDCERNAAVMMRKCRLTCGACTANDDHRPTGPCRDKKATCAELASKGRCVRDPVNMLKDCTKSCEFCPENVGIDPFDKPGECADFDGVCTYWADNNLCQKYYAWMSINCRKACGLCDKTITLPPDCVDKRSSCHERAFSGQCRSSSQYMSNYCKLSCNICEGVAHPNTTCVDYNKDCKDFAERKECYGNPEWMADFCPRSCKVCPGDPPTEPAPCEDYKPLCSWWQERGECQKNPVFMNAYCRFSCGQCTDKTTTPPQTDDTCVDNHNDCPAWAARGDCSTSSYIREQCQRSCQTCQEQPPDACVDDSQSCKDWAEYGDCDKNPNYMSKHCRKSCNMCGAQANCRDDESLCHEWAKNNGCTINPGYMLAHCKKACGVCR